MAESSNLEWVHPQADQGIESHRFHREKVSKVTGKLMEEKDLWENSDIILGLNAAAALKIVKENASYDMPKLGATLLHDLGETAIPGLPLRQNTGLYVEDAAYFIDREGPESSISNPQSGRAITQKLGWVLYQTIKFT